MNCQLVLGGGEGCPVRLIIPLSWLEYSETISVHKCHPFWTSSPLFEYGLVKNSSFVVTNPNRQNVFMQSTSKKSAYGISVSNFILFKEIFHGYSKQPYPLYLGGFIDLKKVKKEGLIESKYQAVAIDETPDLEYAFLINETIKSFKGHVLVETDKKFSKEKYNPYLS